MGKGAKITTISIFLFLIVFFIFLKIFPQGLKFAPATKIEIEGEMMLFGNISGFASAIYSKNFTITVNNIEIKNSTDEVYFEGKIYFNCDRIFISDAFGTNKAYFQGKECYITFNNEKKFYEIIEGEIEGDVILSPSGTIYLNESGNGIEIENSIPFELRSIVLAKNGSFLINENKNFSLIFFNGNGKYIINEKKLYGDAKVIFIDNKFYEKFSHKWLLYLWIFSAIIFIFSLFFKKEQLEEDKNYLGFSIVSSIFFFCISIFLWNCEIKRVIGLDIFDFKNFFKFSLSLLLYILAFALICFPVRIAISSIFEFFGMHNIGRTIARSIAFLMIFILGIIFLPFLMNITLSPLLKYFSLGV